MLKALANLGKSDIIKLIDNVKKLDDVLNHEWKRVKGVIVMSTLLNQVDRENARERATEKASNILLHIRQERNLSQAQLAEISGRKQSYISRVESKQQNISLSTLEEIVASVDGELYLDIKL